ncbi:MAG: baseplate J/gp47 family protein [Bacteroidota bacterium]
MKENCISQNPLVRDGISQQQRLLKTLLPSYVSVDERSIQDLVGFVKDLGSEIQYYEFDGTNVVKDTWDIFFQITTEEWDQFDLDCFIQKLKIDKETQPHLALFFGFLYMFRVAQDDMNTITKRHLDFYYRDVLQLKENRSVPDQAAVLFNLAKNTDSYLVKAGTQLKGGKDDIGVERIYEVEKDIVVNKAGISEMKAVFANIHNSLVSDNSGLENDHRIYASSIANSADGEGAKIDKEEPSWRTFGQPEFTSSAGSFFADRQQPDLGFAFASPILFLAEGTRTVTLEITFDSLVLSKPLENDHFIVKFSGKKEWITAEAVNPGDTSTSGNTLTLKRAITAAQPAVIAYDEETLLQSYKTKWPVMSISLNTEKVDDPFIYKALKSLKPSSSSLTVEVEGVKDLILQNDSAVLDPSKPLLPFGNRPFIGSKLYIGSWEVFQKKLTSLDIKFKWNDLPVGKFEEYYTNYDPFDPDPTVTTSPIESTTRANSSFKLDIAGLHKKKWESLITGNTALFTDSSGTAIDDASNLPGPTAANSKISLTNITKLAKLKRNKDLEKFEAWDVNTQKGFIRLTLMNADFGHSVFPNAYAVQAIELAKDAPDPWAQLPNPPYTPSVQDLSLDYTSSVTFNFDNPSVSVDNREQFFHIEPFGVKEIASGSPSFVLPQFNDEGSLYIGIKDLMPPQSLSLLFQVAEGSANPNRTTQDVNWDILSNNEWIPFDTKTILSDTTNHLLTSGIISFAVPEEATDNNTLLPKDFFWLRATVTEQSDAISRLIDVQAQAVLVKFKDNDNDPDHLRVPLVAESIPKLVTSDSAVDAVVQPYASFGGKVKEESRDYYTRVSERLRHKQRTITIWDYEHITLQHFPSAYKVKCINHTRFEGTLENYSEMAPGHVTLIVVSNVQNKNAVDPLRPMTSLSMLDDIKTYVDALNPMCAEVHVRNPIYEEVKVSFEVKFLADDIGFFQTKLEQEIKGFLSPWSTDCAADITFGGKIHKSVILNFVEERSYVDYVSCFKMFHIVPLDPENDPNKDIDEAIATTAVSILGSADTHEIIPMAVDAEGCVCADNEVVGAEQTATADDCPCHEEITSLEPELPEPEPDIDLT